MALTGSKKLRRLAADVSSSCGTFSLCTRGTQVSGSQGCKGGGHRGRGIESERRLERQKRASCAPRVSLLVSLSRRCWATNSPAMDVGAKRCSPSHTYTARKQALAGRLLTHKERHDSFSFNCLLIESPSRYPDSRCLPVSPPADATETTTRADTRTGDSGCLSLIPSLILDACSSVAAAHKTRFPS